jgi:hypothetical protein
MPLESRRGRTFRCWVTDQKPAGNKRRDHARPHAPGLLASLCVAVSLGNAGPVTALNAQVQRSPAGTAKISLTAEGIAVSGDYQTTLCGGPYLLGKGMSFQTRAGEWQITVASEARTAGKVPLNAPGGGINVIVTVNGPGKRFVRGPRNGGSLEVSSDFRKAEAVLDLRNVVGTDTAKLVATFTCATDSPSKLR